MKREGFQKPRKARFTTESVNEKKPKTGPRLVQKASSSSYEAWLDVVPEGSVDKLMRRNGSDNWLMSSPGWPRAVSASSADDSLVPAAIPLSLSGFSAPAFSEVEKLFQNFPMQPMRAGGTGNAKGGPDKFEMGGAIAVHLIRGDMSAVGTGTVSYIDGNGVLAFGHPMFQVGELYAPVSTAEVHTVIPSAMSAFVIASPNQEIGSLIHDRKSTVSADTSLRSRMVPIDIKVNSKSGESGTFHVEVLNDSFFIGTLAGMAAFNAANNYLPDRDHLTAKIRSKVVVKNHGALEFTDYLYSKNGSLGLIGGARGLRAIMPLVMNPFEPVDIDRVELEIDADYASNFGDIERLRLPTSELTPGKSSYVLVDMTTYNGDRVTQKVPFTVPKKLAGSVVRLEVTAGDATQIDAAPPKNIKEFIALLRELLPGDMFAVTLYTADEGVAIDGKLIRDLPASAADKMKKATRTDPDTTSVYQPLFRSLVKSDRVINGGQSILVRVADLED
jgi:hypothetical protein